MLPILTYMGPPDFLLVDQGSFYVSKEMEETLEASRVTLKDAHIETPCFIGIMYCFHAPLRCTFNKLRF